MSTIRPIDAPTATLRQALATLRTQTGTSSSKADTAGRIKIKAIEYALRERGETT